MKWVKYTKQGKLPLERRSVLVMIDRRQSDLCRRSRQDPGADQDFKDTAPTVAVGYIRVHYGGPFFVVPGVPHKDEEITHWCDCLGDDFTAPASVCRNCPAHSTRTGSRIGAGMPEIDDVPCRCPYCGKTVVGKWERNAGMLSDPNQVLIADWLFHAECWDRQVSENPPNK